MFLVLGFNQLWAPVFYENMNSKSYKTITKLIKSFTVVISILSLSLILFTKEIVLLLIDSNYHSVINIIPLLVLASFFNGLLTISNSFLSFNNNFYKISFFGLIASLLNILLNLVLIPIYGVLGASIALVISYFIFYILGVISEREKITLVQNKKSAYIPPLLLVVGVLGNLFINENIFLNNFSVYEFFAKILYFLFTIIIFFKIKIIEKKDLNLIINLISRKK
jgi:O-antigen/teichoic acid export membrane protein